MKYSIVASADRAPSVVPRHGMNKHTKAVLEVLKGAIDSMEIDSEALNDNLQGSDANIDGDAIDQTELRAQLVKHLSKKALRTADEMIGMVQQIYDL